MTQLAVALGARREAFRIALFALTLTVTCLGKDDDVEDIEVRVQGTNLERRATRDASAASTLLRREDLSSPGATAAAALTRVPGVQVQQTGSSSDLSTASIRGTTSAQTPVYLAGIRLNDDLSGTADLSTIPVWMLDRVEIYRGNAPSNAESLGIGGAVFFEPRYPRGPEARAGLGWGSWGQRTGYVSVGTGSDQVQSLFALRRESARNDYAYFDNAGTALRTDDDHWVNRANADQSTTDWWTVSRLNLGHSSQVLFLSNAFEREQGVPGLLAVPATHSRAHVRRELVGISARSELPCTAHGPCQLLTATSLQWASTALRDPLLELGLGSASVVSDSHRVTQRAQLSWPFAVDWLLTPHATLSVETLDVTRPAINPLEAKRMQGSIGASTQWEATRRLSVIAVARINAEATRSAGADTVQRLPTGRVGAAYRIFDGLKLLANLGYYNRVPTLGELYGTSALVAGNSSLKSETGVNRDIGASYLVRTKPVALSVQAFAFQQDLRDLVAWQRSSFGQIVPYNAGQTRLRGIEIYGGLDVLSVVRLETATTLLDPRAINPEYKNDLLPFRSRLVTDARLELHTRGPSSTLRLRAASVSLRGSHRSSRYQDAAGLIIIPHSTTFDVQSGIAFLDLPLSVRAAIYNIFDQPRFDLVGYPLPPRTFAVEAALEWEHVR